ncbi:unnamed protein product [Ectocarpus sp. 12 AP-2014]
MRPPGIPAPSSIIRPERISLRVQPSPSCSILFQSFLRLALSMFLPAYFPPCSVVVSIVCPDFFFLCFSCWPFLASIYVRRNRRTTVPRRRVCSVKLRTKDKETQHEAKHKGPGKHHLPWNPPWNHPLLLLLPPSSKPTTGTQNTNTRGGKTIGHQPPVPPKNLLRDLKRKTRAGPNMHPMAPKLDSQ